METATDLSPLFSVLEEVPQYRELRQGLASGGSGVAGVSEGVRPFLVAALHRQLHRPLLIVTPRPEAARALHDALSAWATPGTALYLLPEPDALPYERLPADPFAVAERLKALWALARGREGDGAPLVVASAWAAAAATIPYDRFRSAGATLRKGMTVDLPRLLEGWLRAGYEVEEAVEVPGTVSRRGGIVDIFPPTSPHPFRLELEGNRLESLRLFDPTTQRSLQEVAEAAITPAREMVLPPQGTGPEGDFPSPNAPSLSQEARERFTEELSRLKEGAWFPGAEFYAPLWGRGSLSEYLPPSTLIVWDDPSGTRAALEELDNEARQLRQDMEARGELPPDFPVPYRSWDGVGEGQWGAFASLTLERWAEAGRLPFSDPPRYGGQWPLLMKELRRRLGEGHRVVLVSHQAHRLSELLWDEDIPATPSTLDTPPQPGVIKLLSGLVPGGWLLESPPVALLSDAEVFGFVKERRLVQRRPVRRQPFLSQFRVGDYVVHVEHGIGRFAGTTRMEREGEEREYLVLEYAGGDRLYVPADQVDRVGRYFGPHAAPPALSRLGTQEWKHTRARAKKAAEAVAKDLLQLYAARQVVNGLAFPPDTPWQQELEAAFPYVETPDQAEAARQVKEDMERPQPMDRLVCGDVGYGKTEVAIRAAFKAVMDGRQVALLVPTTVLAQQHYHTFSQRLAPFPAKLEVLSRFRSHQEQKAVLHGLRDGSVDICIGTHRLLQKDVAFKDLGLVIVDEEQRFGVMHKERLKQMRQEVDVLTLSATPIPRTLYMSLAGVRDMSVMETPPEERLPVKTYVAEYDERLVREAIIRELERGGQVFFVHNRVETIQQVARQLEALVPEARIAVAHGQMDEAELERVMLEFTSRQWDVLVCSTIIESGLDVPNANTLIVNQADRLGLTQLYQLRGRVGRGTQRAYAYFFFHREKRLTPQAQQRLSAIHQATELGAGFQIAMRDLEIRGAGNLLGTKQSGHIGAVGFELYARLLAQAVEELKTGAPPPPPAPEPTISLPLPAFLPEPYVADLHARLAIYQRLAGVLPPKAIDGLEGELRDRFGPLPPEAANLLLIVRLKALAREAGVEAVSTESSHIVLQWPEGQRVDRSRLPPTLRVKVGTSQVRLPLARGWPQLLQETLKKTAALPAEKVAGKASVGFTPPRVV